MIVEVKVPEVGESISEGVLVAWAKADGELVQADEPLFELETDKITLNVQAPEAGRLIIRVPAGQRVQIGQVVGTLDTAVSAPPREQARSAELSPAVRRLVEEHGLEPEQLPASGKGGRITKEDVLHYLASREHLEARPSAALPAHLAQPSERQAQPSERQAQPSERQAQPSERQTRRPMSSLRRRLAERLVEAQQSAAILTTFNEADLSAVSALRERQGEAFAQRHGVRLGFMSFFIKAAVEALRELPIVNSRLEGDEIVENHFYDIGVAVATEQGLVVPVIRDADRLSFAALEQSLADFAARARARKLELSELQGGTFSITNGGVFGSLLSTPLLNPPQSAILGLHAIKPRPVVVAEQIVVRPMMYLALSYDHRLIDGREAVLFLRNIITHIENPERLFLEI